MYALDSACAQINVIVYFACIIRARSVLRRFMSIITTLFELLKFRVSLILLENQITTTLTFTLTPPFVT